MRDFKLALLLVVLTTTLVACGNSDNDEGGTDSQTPPDNDELSSVLDVFSIDGVKVPFMEIQENSEGELSPQTAGYFEDGQYIVDGLRDHDMDDFQTMSTDEITSEIDSIVSEIDRPVNASDTVSMDYVVEPYYETLHVFKRESETDGSTSLQIPIFFTMPNVVTGNVPADMDEAQLDSFIRTERENRFLTGEPINSVDIKLNARGPIVKSNSDTGKPYEDGVGYLTAFSINDPVQFLEETTRTEREKALPVFKSVDPNKYESWVEIRPDANARGGTRSLLIYKTPEVIETLNLDSDSGLVKLTDEDDGDKVYVHVINE